MESIHSLQSILDKLYTEMMPMCGQLIGVARLIAGFGALWFIGSRIWKHIAAAEPVDIYPLFRPFVLGFCILIFPSVIALINGVLHPTVVGTEAMIRSPNAAMNSFLDMQPPTELYSPLDALNPSVWFRELLKQFLQIIFETAALCINTIRTFYLIVLAILGPFVFGLSVYDGFQHTVTVWLARYINVYLWLPVANIFSAIIAKIQLCLFTQTGTTTSDIAYIIFMLIAIVGYFTVPSVANYIVNAGGGNTLLYKVSNAASSGAGMAGYFKDKIGGK